MFEQKARDEKDDGVRDLGFVLGCSVSDMTSKKRNTLTSGTIHPGFWASATIYSTRSRMCYHIHQLLHARTPRSELTAIPIFLPLR